jgi:hypothetical protein
MWTVDFLLLQKQATPTAPVPQGGTELLKIMNSALGSITVTASGILKDYLFWSLDNFTDFKPQTREAIESDLEEAEE